jgi:glycine cleavage system H lipoate-binding protein
VIFLPQYAPVSGTVVETNGELVAQPGLINRSAEDKGIQSWFLNIDPLTKSSTPGWICKIELSDPTEVRVVCYEGGIHINDW